MNIIKRIKERFNPTAELYKLIIPGIPAEERKRKIENLLAEGADINAQNKGDGRTPLTQAIILDLTNTALFLLKKGADPNKAARNGGTPFVFATERGNIRVMQALLDHPKTYTEKELQNPARLFSVLLREQDNAPDILEVFLANGANPNLSNAKGVTPLRYAVVRYPIQTKMIELLLAYGANIALTITNEFFQEQFRSTTSQLLRKFFLIAGLKTVAEGVDMIQVIANHEDRTTTRIMRANLRIAIESFIGQEITFEYMSDVLRVFPYVLRLHEERKRLKYVVQQAEANLDAHTTRYLQRAKEENLKEDKLLSIMKQGCWWLSKRFKLPQELIGIILDWGLEIIRVEKIEKLYKLQYRQAAWICFHVETHPDAFTQLSEKLFYHDWTVPFAFDEENVSSPRP